MVMIEGCPITIRNLEHFEIIYESIYYRIFLYFTSDILYKALGILNSYTYFFFSLFY